ncbi:MAG TPA: hypothetical protein PKN29_13305 [Candidatus Ozemobacteraceae bacterium]|nr:hypothetical protein [Candidatus Ozemobacteraceae bacterium]
MVNELKKIDFEEELRRMEDREREAFDMAVIKGAAYRQGKAEGKLEGRLEGKLEIAGNFYKLGCPLEEICAATGLGIDELKKYLATLTRP